MADSTDRIEQALARIEAAASVRAYASARLARRHALLRQRMEEAVAAIDVLIENETATAEEE